MFLVKILQAQTQTGQASFYADFFEGRSTASGEKYHAGKATAAHKTFPFGTVLKVTNLANNESAEVTVNDRGPFVAGRIIDVTKSVAAKLGFVDKGVANVKIEVVTRENSKTNTQPVEVNSTSVSDNEYYDIEISKVEPNGFGAQIGTYQELTNLLRLADNLKKSYKKKATVSVKAVKGAKYYSLILGSFSSQTKAQDFVNKLKKQFPDAFVLDYSKH